LKIGGADTIGIFKKEYLYLFQYVTKIQRSFAIIESTDIWFSDKNLQDTAKTSPRKKPQDLVYPSN
jgi:hypothetical protein